jgi:WD40 repeat protein
MYRKRRPWIVGCLGIFVALVTTILGPVSVSPPDDAALSTDRRAPVVRIGHSVGVDTVAVAPDGTLIASGSRDNTVRLW